MRALGVAAIALAFAAPAFGAANPGTPAAGKVVFKAECGACHTLAAAGTKGKGANAGPVLTGLKVSYARVMKQMLGGSGLMPAFVGVLTTTQMQNVAAFVAQATAAT